jgi:hypothetical protein
MSRGTGQYPDLATYWRALRGHRPRPAAPFARFLWDEWQRSGLGLHAFGRQVLGISTLDKLIAGHEVSQATYNKLKERYGDALPAGPIDTATRAARMKRVRIQPGPEIVRKRAGSQRGMHYSEAVRARRRERWAALTPEERRARTAHFDNRPIMQSLRVHLRWVAEPGRQQLQAWAEGTGKRFQLPASAVLAAWKPCLQRRGLWPKGGRPPQIDYLQVHEWRQQRVKWEVIGSRLGHDPEVLQVGYARWKRGPKP